VALLVYHVFDTSVRAAQSPSLILLIILILNHVIHRSYLIDLVAGAGLAVSVFYFFITEDPAMRDWHIQFPSSYKALLMNQRERSNGYALTSSSTDDGPLSNGDASYLRDLENSAAASSGGASNGSLGMHDLSKEAQSAQEYELPLSGNGNGTASRRGSLPSNSNPSLTMSNGSLNPSSAADSSAGTTSSHSPRIAAVTLANTPRGGSPASNAAGSSGGHANPFLSAPALNRSTSQDRDGKGTEAGLARPRTPSARSATVESQ
jgi:hypothetical protein